MTMSETLQFPLFQDVYAYALSRRKAFGDMSNAEILEYIRWHVENRSLAFYRDETGRVAGLATAWQAESPQELRFTYTPHPESEIAVVGAVASDKPGGLAVLVKALAKRFPKTKQVFAIRRGKPKLLSFGCLKRILSHG